MVAKLKPKVVHELSEKSRMTGNNRKFGKIWKAKASFYH